MSDEFRMKFQLGQIVATPGALRVSPIRLARCLTRHARGDWGFVDAEDKQANDRSLIDSSRVLSAYPINPDKPCEGDNRLWIITEADRSVTTFLLPEEY